MFFVPLEQCEDVKNAMFKAGAGKIGSYDSCSFQIIGKGQFRPLEGSNAFLGKVGEVEIVDEARVEIVCENNLLQGAICALKDSHPYETPAYEVYTIEL